MLSLTYLFALLFSIGGMTILDWRYKLAYFTKPRTTALTLTIGVVAFIIWDILGISLGVFFSGDSPYMSGLFLGPDFPIEELFFLYFLCYFTLIMYRLLEEKWQRTS